MFAIQIQANVFMLVIVLFKLALASSSLSQLTVIEANCRAF